MNSIFLQAQGGGFDPIQFLLLGGIFVVMYFFMIRPQSKRAKEQTKFQEDIKAGDKVVTTAGIHGKVIKMEEKSLLLEVDNNVKLRVDKVFISFELTKAAQPAPTTPAEK